MAFSFRTKVVLWHSLTSVLVLLFAIVGLAIVIGVNIDRDEREELRHLATEIDTRLATVDLSADSVMPTKAVDSALALLFDDEDRNLGYRIARPDGEPVHTYFQASVDPFSRLGKDILDDRHQVLRSSYKDWTFYYHLNRPNYLITVSSAHHFEFIDHMLIAIAVLLPLSVGLAVASGVIVSSKVVSPLLQISDAAARVESGDLKARVQVEHSGDEIEALAVRLNSTFDQLEKSFAQISQFSADAAHELRTPLTVIRGNLEVCMRSPRTSEEYVEAMAEAVDEIARVSHMIADLLQLAKSAADFDLAAQPVVDLSDLLQETIDQISIIADDKSIRLELEIEGASKVRGTRSLLQRLVYNLIHNAIKYSASESTVEIRLKQAGHTLRLIVTDHGMGIAKEHTDRIFDRFYQVDNSRTTGNGLGLPLCQWIATAHGGSICVSSDPGNGSTFTVVLPVAEA